jgi:hypothetical protein
MTAVGPVTYAVTPQAEKRNRLTSFFRIVLAIPHIALVGGPGVGIGAGGSKTGVLGMAALVVAFVNWFIIVFTGRADADLVSLQQFYLRWRARAMAYMALLRDEYPPFGDRGYPVAARFDAVLENRNRLTVGFRFVLVIPQLIVLFFLIVAWAVTAIIGWFAILFAGRYPEELWRFGEGVMRWALRVEAYWLLLHDEYPPFSLDDREPAQEGQE